MSSNGEVKDSLIKKQNSCQGKGESEIHFFTYKWGKNSLSPSEIESGLLIKTIRKILT